MKKLSLAIQTCLVMLIPFSGMAHPGHGETEGFSIIHYFTEPVHATATIVMIVAIVIGVRYLHKNRSQDKGA